MNCELLDLRAFLAVLDLRSFVKSAQMLNISQPALSRRIQALEAAFGAPLLERTTRSVTPTALGRELEPMIRRLLGDSRRRSCRSTRSARSSAVRSRSPASR